MSLDSILQRFPHNYTEGLEGKHRTMCLGSMYSQFAMARKGERQECHHSFLTSRPEERRGAPILELESPLSILHPSFQLAISLFNIQDALSPPREQDIRRQKLPPTPPLC